MTQKMSLSLKMRRSSPSSLISFPPYCPNTTVSPSLTFSGLISPESFFLPGPTEITVCWDGFSFDDPYRIIPPD